MKQLSSFNQYVSNPIIQAQHKQLCYAKKHRVTSRNNYAVITYAHMSQLKHKAGIKESMRLLNSKPIISYERLNKQALKRIYNKYLRNWNMALRASLLNGVFFRNYAQAYRALRTMAEMGLLVKQKKNFFVK